MNKMAFYLSADPRAKPLREALYRAIGRRSPRAPAPEQAGAPALS
jgi:hypothetical protein